jgi:hypothetical protein
VPVWRSSRSPWASSPSSRYPRADYRPTVPLSVSTRSKLPVSRRPAPTGVPQLHLAVLRGVSGRLSKEEPDRETAAPSGIRVPCGKLPARLRARDPIRLINQRRNGREPGGPRAADGAKGQDTICRWLYCPLGYTTKIQRKKEKLPYSAQRRSSRRTRVVRNGTFIAEQ